ncbi:hypothetical protein [Chitinophaga rhizosphaerae]|uniref:hypothetical protein n=1 Tax=Chitinophaga rhizosphaerae TaxID=1864947 RepID=UPI000F80938D|nr:hypothetical protein [Chitinophaga rhizosphaerae]
MHRKVYRLLLSLLLPVVFGTGMRYVMDVFEAWDLLGVMSIAFLFFVPFGMGFLLVWVAAYEQSQRRDFAVIMPWASLAIFLGVTISLRLEGWACWLMAFPLFMLASSLGGLTGRGMRRRNHERKNIHVSLLLLLPVFISPIEQWIGNIPGRYKAYTYIDIQAPKNRIWPLVTRVSDINAEENKAGITRWLLFPQPVRAELDKEGTGGFRKAVFTGGLVFDETVEDYRHQEFMRFTIKANPYDIPSTTMDEHIVIGGKFFDVLNGTYDLEQVNDSTCRLHLYSNFKLSTTFNWYASIWAGWIMEDIQDNILQVIRRRAEGPL